MRRKKAETHQTTKSDTPQPTKEETSSKARESTYKMMGHGCGGSFFFFLCNATKGKIGWVRTNTIFLSDLLFCDPITNTTEKGC